MGLLSKAASGSLPALDEMGKALCTRLLSLTGDQGRPLSALSLLRAYAPFQSGLCLALKKNFYSAYAQTGMSGEAVVFPRELLKTVPGKNYFSVDWIPSRTAGTSRFWAFPLSPAAGPLFLFMAAGSSIQHETIEAVLAQAGSVFRPLQSAGEAERSVFSPEDEGKTGFPAETGYQTKTGLQIESIDIELEDSFSPEGGGFNVPAPVSPDREISVLSGIPGEKTVFSRNRGLLSRITGRQNGPGPVSPREKEVMEILDRDYQSFAGKPGIFQGILLETGGELSGIEAAVSGFAAVRSFAPGRFLVLFGPAEDGGLVARHLEKTLPGKNIFHFNAGDPRDALSLLKPYL